jgi:superkiller protein 3
MAFGNLKILERELALYIEKSSFTAMSYDVPLRVDEKAFSTRRLSEAETLGVRADFIVHGLRPSRARPLILEALKKDPDLMLGHECMGFAYVREQRSLDAVRSFERAIELGSQNYLIHFEVARKGFFPAAEKQNRYERVIELNPEFVPALYTLAKNRLKQRTNLEVARTLAKRILKIEPKDSEAHLLLGSVHNAMNRPDIAVPLFRRAVALSPASSRARYHLGSTLLRIGELNESIRAFEAAVELDRGYTHAHHQLGLAYLKKERPADAAACFRTVLNLEPNNAAAHFNLGLSLQQLDSFEEAGRELERARRLGFDPK